MSAQRCPNCGSLQTTPMAEVPIKTAPAQRWCRSCDKTYEAKEDT